MEVSVAGEKGAVRVRNREGSSPFLIVCDHASNFVPSRFANLGLSASDLTRHIAWDPGALPVSEYLSRSLDATLVESRISRLIIDCNRPLDADNLFWTVSEGTTVPGNQNLTQAQRDERIELGYRPYHEAIERTIEARLDEGRETWLVAVHSFTPVYNGKARPWQVGIIHDDDERLSAPLIQALRRDPSLNVGVNEPYSPADKVYFTLERHARSRRLPCVMIEIRNDEIGDRASQDAWGRRLAEILSTIRGVETADDDRGRARLSA